MLFVSVTDVLRPYRLYAGRYQDMTRKQATADSLQIIVYSSLWTNLHLLTTSFDSVLTIQFERAS